MTEEQLQELNEERNEFRKHGLVFSPNSIWHGTVISRHSNETLLRIEIGNLTNFIDFLFNHSEHCDHIAESDAVEEFVRFVWGRNLKVEDDSHSA